MFRSFRLKKKERERQLCVGLKEGICVMYYDLKIGVEEKERERF